jgi:PEP-CTERM motif
VAKGGPSVNLFTDSTGLPVTTGTWFTPLNNGGNQTGLSHIDFYDTTGTPVPPSQVPAPGALVLLGTGLVGMAAAGRKVLGRR